MFRLDLLEKNLYYIFSWLQIQTNYVGLDHNFESGTDLLCRRQVIPTDRKEAPTILRSRNSASITYVNATKRKGESGLLCTT